MNEEIKEIPVEEINGWVERLDSIIHAEIRYDKDHLVMANAAIDEMKEQAIELINKINMYTEF